MHPTLVEIGRFGLHSYGLMLALSFLAGIYVAARRARKYGVDVQLILDLSVYIILASVVGARLAYIAFHLGDYRNFLDIFALWQGGATFYGGLILALLTAYYVIYRKGVSFLLVADVMAPSIALGVAMTRIGCFLSGCCFGKPTTLPWGVVFPPNSAAGIYARSMPGQALTLHPTQLYSSLGGLVIFTILMFMDGKLARKGATFGLFLVLYGIHRFIIDFFRYYENNMITFGLTLNQILSVGLFIIGLFLLARRSDPKPGMGGVRVGGTEK